MPSNKSVNVMLEGLFGRSNRLDGTNELAKHVQLVAEEQPDRRELTYMMNRVGPSTQPSGKSARDLVEG